MKDITDGTSKTAFVSELILSPDRVDDDLRGRYYNARHGGTLFSTVEVPNSAVPDRLFWCSTQPVPEAPCNVSATDMFVAPRSYHPGGANVSFADGSVQFITGEVDKTVFRATGSRSGNENVGSL